MIDKINERFPKILFFCIILNQLKSVCDVELWIYCMDLQILLTHTNSQHIGSIDLFNWLNEFVHLLIEKSSFLECLSNVLNISCNKFPNISTDLRVLHAMPITTVERGIIYIYFFLFDNLYILAQ